MNNFFKIWFLVIAIIVYLGLSLISLKYIGLIPLPSGAISPYHALTILWFFGIWWTLGGFTYSMFTKIMRIEKEQKKLN